MNPLASALSRVRTQLMMGTLFFQISDKQDVRPSGMHTRTRAHTHEHRRHG